MTLYFSKEICDLIREKREQGNDPYPGCEIVALKPLPQVAPGRYQYHLDKTQQFNRVSGKTS